MSDSPTWKRILWICVECEAVFGHEKRRCPVCEHGPENSQPTMKPFAVPLVELEAEFAAAAHHLCKE